MKKIIILMASALAFGTAQAAVIDNGDVNGFGTFRDTNTGRVWLDLDSFFDQSPNAMIAAASAAGFTFATLADVQGLLNTLPLNSGEWSTYTTIMGRAPVRNLIWGAYDDGFDPNRIGWAYSWDSSTEWNYADNSWDLTSAPNAGTNDADLALWAFQTGDVVPEPASLALIGLGLAGLGLLRRKSA